MPRTYGYCRVSTLKQEKEGTSLDEQRERNHAYAVFLKTRIPDLIVPEPEQLNFVDAGVTSDIYLMERPAGAAMFSRLQNGDHIIVSLFDRAFRSAADLEMVLAFCKSRDIHLHILDFPYDMSTAEGQLLLGIIASVKRFEKQNIKERITRGVRRSFVSGRANRPSLGWKYTGQKIGGYKKVIPDLEFRAAAEDIVRLKEEEGLSFYQIYHRLLRDNVRRENVDGRYIKGGAEWSFGAIQRAYKAAKAGYPQTTSKWEPSASPSAATAGPPTATVSPPPPEA